MTPKELLYIEDALGHTKQMQTTCTDFAPQIKDPELQNFISALSSKHSECFTKFYSLLKG